MIKNLVKTVTTFCSKNASTILTIGACAGVAATGYFAFKSGVKTVMDLQDIEFEKAGEDITPKDKAMIIVKDCAVPAAVGGLTMAMIISSRIIDIKRAKAMAASYAILAESADTFRRKAIEKAGERKIDEIRGEIAKDEFKDSNDDIQAESTQGGNFLFKDQITKVYFRADADFVRKVQNKVNAFYAQGENFVTVSEWYSYLGLESPGEPVSELGWPASCGIKFDLASTICPNGEPGYYIMYEVPPMTQEEGEAYDANHYILDY